MPIAHSSSSSGGAANASSLTFSHTVSGSETALLVGIYISGGTRTVSSVTYAGVTMTEVGTRAAHSYDRVSIYKLSAPTAGANNVVVTLSGNMNIMAGATSFTGAHQTTASLTGTFASHDVTSTTSISVNVSSASGEIVIDVCGSYPTLTVGAGQTERWTQPNVGADSADAKGSTEPGAGTVAMSWTVGSNDDLTIGAVSVKPAPSTAPALDYLFVQPRYHPRLEAVGY